MPEGLLESGLSLFCTCFSSNNVFISMIAFTVSRSEEPYSRKYSLKIIRQETLMFSLPLLI